MGMCTNRQETRISFRVSKIGDLLHLDMEKSVLFILRILGVGQPYEVEANDTWEGFWVRLGGRGLVIFRSGRHEGQPRGSAAVEEHHDRPDAGLKDHECGNSAVSSAGPWVLLVILQDASLKPFGKHLGPFAAFKRDEAEISGVPFSSKIRWVQDIATQCITGVIFILFINSQSW